MSFSQRTVRWYHAIAACATLIVLLAGSGQVLAREASPSVPTPPVSCGAAPHIQPPPLPRSVPKTTALKPICANGQVPHLTNTASVHSKGIAPARQRLQQLKPSIAAGYHYVYGYQYTTGIGAEGYYTQHTPFLSSSDSHTLAEIAGESTDGQQIVEIGWTVDRGLNGDSNPHLFVFSWVNRVPNCYNGCGYVQYSSTFFPGMTVAGDGSQHFYAMQNYNGNWWLFYDTQWIGYFPGTIWSNQNVTFNQLGLIQWFGEVSSGGGTNTQMGNGIFGSNAGSASIVNAAVITSASSATLASVNIGVTDPSCYNSGWITMSYSFSYGGPGC